MKNFINFMQVTTVFCSLQCVLLFLVDVFGIFTTNILISNTYIKGHVLYLFVLFLLFSFIITLKMIRQIFEIRKKLKQI